MIALFAKSCFFLGVDVKLIVDGNYREFSTKVVNSFSVLLFVLTVLSSEFQFSNSHF